MQKRLTDDTRVNYPPQTIDQVVYGEGTSRSDTRSETCTATDEPIPEVVTVKAIESAEDKQKRIARRRRNIMILIAFIIAVFWIWMMFFADITTKGKVFSYDYDRSDAGLTSVQVQEECPGIVLTSEERQRLEELMATPEMQEWVRQWENYEIREDGTRGCFRWPEHHTSEMDGHEIQMFFKATEKDYAVGIDWKEETDGKQYDVELSLSDSDSFKKIVRPLERGLPMIEYRNIDGDCVRYDLIFHHQGLVDLLYDAPHKEE